MLVEGRVGLSTRDRCPICEQSHAKVLIRESYGSPAMKEFLRRQYRGVADAESLTEFHYELVRCGNCQFAYQQTIPDDPLVAQIYDVWIPPTEKERIRRERTLDDYRYMAEGVEFVIQHFGFRPYELRALDFGMGWAEWASMARAYGCQVAGSELSQHRIDNARAMGLEVVGWDEIPGRRFHFINTEQVFEHLVEPLTVLRHLAKGLAVDGLVRIAVPNATTALKHVVRDGDFAKLTADDIMPIQPLEHINCFEFASLATLAQRAGLRVIRPKLRQLYNSSSGWLSLGNAVRLATRPVYRHVYPKSTIAYLTPL
jgi:hypothetical protein